MPLLGHARPILVICTLALTGACSTPSRSGEPIDLLISGGTVITMDSGRRVLDSTSVAIAGDSIVAIGPASELAARFAPRETIDATHHIVMPGLIDGHGHAGHGLVKSLGMDEDQFYPMTEKVYAAASSLDFWRAEALLTGVERLRFGVTTALTFLGGGDMIMRTDETRYGDAYMQAMDSVGLRFFLAVGPRRPPFPKQYVRWTGAAAAETLQVSFDDQLQVSRALIDKWNGARSGRLHIALAFPTHHPAQGPWPDSVLSEIVRQAKATRALSREKKVLFTQDGHAAGSIQFANDVLGVLGPDALFSHATGMSDAEIAMVARTGTKIVHNPSANAAIREPFRLVELLDAGATVMLGSDGVAPDRSYDMLRHVFQAMRYHRAMFRDTRVLPAGKALEMVTIDAARALGIEREVGSLEVGKKADVILIDWRRPHLMPMQMPVYRVAYFANGNDVSTVIVAGRVLMKDRKVLSVDEPTVLDYAQRESELAIRRAGIEKLTSIPEGFWSRSRMP